MRRENDERQPLLARRRSFDEYETASDGITSAAPLAGGTVLGIHNLAIVMPQFVVSLLSYLSFGKFSTHYISGRVGNKCHFPNCRWVKARFRRR